MRKLPLVVAAALLALAPNVALAQASELDQRLCASREDFDVVIAACTRVIDQGGLDDARLGSAYRSRANIHWFKQEYQSALADLDRAIVLRPSDPDALVDRGFVRFALRDYPQAIADYDRSLRLRPDDALALTRRAGAYAASDRLERAIEDYSAALAVDRAFPPAWNGRCDANARLGRLDAALADCTEMITRGRGHIAFGYDSRGRVHLLAGRADAAIADFTAAIRLFPNLQSALYGRGLARQRKGDLPGAAQDMAAARAISPDIADHLAVYGLK